MRLGILILVAVAVACSSQVTYSLWETEIEWPDRADAGTPTDSHILERERGLQRAECELARDRSVRGLIHQFGPDSSHRPDGGWYRGEGRVVETIYQCLVTGQQPETAVPGTELRVGAN